MVSPSSIISEDPAEVFIRAIDLDAVRELALNVRLAKLLTAAGNPSLIDIACSVISPPKYGSYNVVYELQLSDGVSWVLRLPFSEWTPSAARNMELDMVALDCIARRTSVPIPHIHAYSTSTDNPVRNAYIIMDKIHGVPLAAVWHDESWWTGKRRKENFFESLAECMVQLASIQFGRIGRLDRVSSEGSLTEVVIPFPSVQDMFFLVEAPTEEFGPFSTTHEYLTALLRARRRVCDYPTLALLQMFIGGLPDPQFDAAPFAFAHPDYSLHNIIVDDMGVVSGIIDWDGVAIEPLHCGALRFPPWLILDWDPPMYEASKVYHPVDSQEDLHRYRRMYVDAVDAASGGKLSAATRNSHITSGLSMAITNPHQTEGIATRLTEFVLGSSVLAVEVMYAIERGAWFTTPPTEVPEVIRKHLHSTVLDMN
ncbi:hypothetical protein BN946_scf184324.g3 [Trametes cinnabarina]|uniref:Aminoglycoside phosphotransferase domain-containing protein n=1 Tax=Pycnoporus cinnabarinus TaxID=5643 RepID=A0A060SK58_PYCCI|nr:hypothetical protein BN946_scf184324.g3 [Trametes cinnabarina]